MRPFGAALLALLGLGTVALGGCARKTQPSAEPSPAAPVAAETTPERAITRLHPSESVRGTGFNRQPDGSSAIAVEGTGFVRGDQVHWGGEPLETVFGSETTLTAAVPKELIDRVGEVTVSVRNPADPQIREVQAVFHVRPAGQGAAE